MDRLVTTKPDREKLITEFERIRNYTECLCTPLLTEDYQIQSIDETSPPKWHIAHVSWFFETFVLSHFQSGYKPWRTGFDFLFNSYYYTHGQMSPRPSRGLLSRPSVDEIYAYRSDVNEKIKSLIETAVETDIRALTFRMQLGLHHEQQHQELLLMDIKHNFSINPCKPAYRDDLIIPEGQTRPLNWVECDRGIYQIGHTGKDFAFDNETPLHEVLIHDHRLADRFITNGEYLEFIEDGGYGNPALWLSDGWALIRTQQWHYPLYWENRENEWQQFTLGGTRKLNPHEPVCHLSFYEADAYARWAGKRLPREEELEIRLELQPVAGNFAEKGLLHPAPASDQPQWFGDLWAWTCSAYTAYPGFKPLAGTMGEYNGKFMSGQMVLKGGSCATPTGHTRASYRNFYYPENRWPFTGLRLAEDL
jgi:ergothioneine biosynthesis protein EgtB